ncbi:MAG TPA: ATP-binding protein [Candidatus Cloacimonadota bacterium]|nr:ATP-binding protein [Candidatus Cloacimonadota bacterium]
MENIFDEMTSIHRVRFILVIITLLLVILFSFIIHFETHKLKIVYNHETQFNQQYLYLLRDYLQQNLYVTNLIQRELFERNEIVINEAMEKENNAYLDSLIVKFDIQNLTILNNKGEMLYSYPYEMDFPYKLANFNKTNRISIYDPKTNPKWVYLVMWHHGLWYISQISKQKYLKMINPITFQNIFHDINTTSGNKIAPYPSIEFIAVQDTTGIVSASSSDNHLSKIADDRFLMNILKFNKINSRKLIYKNRIVLETAMPFLLANNDKVIIRIGTSFERVDEYKHQITMDIILYSFIVMLILCLEFVFYFRSIKYIQLTKAYEDQRRLSEIGKLGGEIAHEIKNPLQNINLLLQKVKDHPSDQQTVDFNCDLIHQQIGIIDNITNKFLTFSRVVKLNYQQINIAEAIQEVLKEMAIQIESRQARLNLSGRDDICWHLDREIFKNIIFNLLKNALEASEKKNDLQMDICWLAENGKLTVEINDNAGGIKPDIFEKIFDLYFTTKSEGHGIGLPICRKYVEAMNGIINFTNQYPTGLNVTMIFQKNEVRHENITD